jgi:NADPH:quinone reductase-like Zn-dependent oxidoreductase
MADMLR